MALTAKRNTVRKGDTAVPETLSLPVKGSTHIFQGSLVGIDTSGLVVPASATASIKVIGRAEEDVDNSNGADSALNVRIAQGVFRWGNSGSSDAIAADDVGKICYAVDDQTVALTDGSGLRPIAGLIVGVESAGVYVESRLGTPTSVAALTSSLASAANGAGASLIGVEDALSLLTAATVEAAIAELAKYQTINLADPGTGAAIPVTRSAYVGMTCAGSETNTLAIPTFLGQRLVLNLDTATSGSRVVTAAQAVNQTGNNTLTFASARDCIELVAIKVGGAFRWQVVANDGVALSTV